MGFASPPPNFFHRHPQANPGPPQFFLPPAFPPGLPPPQNGFPGSQHPGEDWALPVWGNVEG